MIDPTPPTFVRGQQARRPSPLGLALMAACLDAIGDTAPPPQEGAKAEPKTFTMVLGPNGFVPDEGQDPFALARRPSLADVAAARPLPRPLDENRAARDQLVRAIDDIAEFAEQIADALKPVACLAELAEFMIRKQLDADELAEFDGQDDEPEAV